MRFGAHESIQGGLDRACSRVRRDGGQVVQIFTKAPQIWKSPPLQEDAIEAFKEARNENQLHTVLVHDSYLINPCSENTETRDKSWQAIQKEAKRCDQLGAEYLVIHPGSPGNLSEKEGIALAAECLKQTLAETQQVTILVETTAGQGKSLGHRFEHLAAIIEKAGSSQRLGACLDTCHMFAAGYDIRDETSARAVLKEFDKVVGAARLRAFHLNDSKKPLGSRVDRHERLGKGEIGLDLFRFLANEPRFAEVPGILETPITKGETFGPEIDLLNSLVAQ